MKWFMLLFVTNLFVFVYCASIFDLLTLDPEGRDDDSNKNDGDVDIDDVDDVITSDKKNCICNGPSCICCVDFNMTLIDLGGPGCVRLNYLSANEGIAINVSYGETSLHSEIVKGPDPAPTCLSWLSKLAQMCATFSELLPTDDGLRGCLKLEPKILGDVQFEIPIGCFRMGPNGMTVIESSNQIIKETQPTDDVTTEKLVVPTEELIDISLEKNTTAENEEDIAGFNTADIIAAVNESAEQGIALITNWLGLNVNKLNKGNETSSAPTQTDTSTSEKETVTYENESNTIATNEQRNDEGVKS